MRRLAFLLFAALFLARVGPLLAQDAPAQAAATPPASPAAAPPAAAEAASPVPAETPWLAGYIDLGYRWLTNVGGSLDTYRSLIDLGSGPKVLGADFTLTDPSHRAFDRVRVRASGWGDEPYQTFHLDATKSKLYDFSADYRDMAYFNFLPSFADPLLSRGIALDEQSFDIRRRNASSHLDLLPGNWLIPYFDYDRDSGIGPGYSRPSSHPLRASRETAAVPAAHRREKDSSGRRACWERGTHWCR